PQAGARPGRRTRSFAVLADPPRHPGQRQRHRRRDARHPRTPPGADQGPPRQARSQPQLPAPVQTDVKAEASRTVGPQSGHGRRRVR
nr:hypothetical protein [Tanacetum cinerariifolium]